MTGRPNRITAIASGKGGVGKTWLAISLAHAAALAGRKVLLVDGDLGLANVDIQLGLTPPHDLGAVAAGRVSLAAAIVRHAPGRFDILAGRSGSGALAALDPAALETVLGALAEAASRYALTLLDLGAGLERPVRRMAAFADRLLVVATEEPTSLTDAYAVLKLHAADRPDLIPAVVVNQAASRPAGERTHAALNRAAGTFLKRTPPLAGVIRRDPRVNDAIRHQTLMLTRHPTSPAATDVLALADALLGGAQAVKPVSL